MSHKQIHPKGWKPAKGYANAILSEGLTLNIAGQIGWNENQEFIAKDFIFDTIIFGPKKIDFPTYKWFCHLSESFGQGDSFCISEMPFRIQSRTVAGQFSAHLWTSILAGFIVAFPYVILEFWKFVSPGLHENERKNRVPARRRVR